MTKEYQAVVYFVCDTTGSMGDFIVGLRTALQQVIPVSKLLLGSRLTLRIVTYEDYCDGDRFLDHCFGSNSELGKFASTLQPRGGGDYPEAQKTALNFALHSIKEQKALNENVQAYVFHYTDAPPHCQQLGGSNRKKEVEYLAAKGWQENWMKLAEAFKENNVSVVTFTDNKKSEIQSFYNVLGSVVQIDNSQPFWITKATIGVFLQIVGETFDYQQKTDKFGKVDAINQLDNLRQSVQAMESGKSIPKSLIRQISGMEFDPAFAVASANPVLQISMKSLEEQFKNGGKYQEMVFGAMDLLFTPENVLALTYNPISGKLWRLCCTCKDHPQLEQLCNKLSACHAKIEDENQQGQLKYWIQMSYDYREEINELIQSQNSPLPCLVLDAIDCSQSLSAEDLRSLSTAPTPGVLSQVQRILTHLILIESGNPPVSTDDDCLYLPLSLSNKDMFSVLSHLIVPGSKFSLRPAMVMALLVVMSGNATLLDRATEHLKQNKGKWLRLENLPNCPDLAAAEFVRFIQRVRKNVSNENDYFTSNEQAFFDRLYVLQRLRAAKSKLVPFDQGFTPKVENTIPDIKQKCSQCGLLRSTTITENGVCGLCLVPEDAVCGTVDNGKKRRATQHTSHFAQCRTCCALYEVVEINLLNVEPKCHYCRLGLQNRPTVQCTKCLNEYIDPSGVLRGTSENMVCEPCKNGKLSTIVEVGNVPVEQLLIENTSLIKQFQVSQKYVKSVLGTLGYFKQYVAAIGQDVDNLESWFAPLPLGHLLLPNRLQAEPPIPTTLTYKGKQIIDSVNFTKKLKNEVLFGSLRETCQLCFEDVHVSQVDSACGNCPYRVCHDCSKQWYQQCKPGCLALPTHLTCPFCKQRPQGSLLQKYNKQACLISRAVQNQIQADMYYAWCQSCFKIKEYMPRECGDGATIPQFTGFECGECKAAKARKREAQEKLDNQYLQKKYKQEGKLEINGKQWPWKCPGCGILTEKDFGCNKIQCTCGTVWCWGCGEKSTATEIYSHIQNECTFKLEKEFGYTDGLIANL